VILFEQHAHFKNVHFQDTCLWVQSGASVSLADCQFTMAEGASTGVSLLSSDGTVTAHNCAIQCDRQAVYIAGSKGSLHAEQLTCTGSARGILLCDKSQLILSSSVLHGLPGEGSIGLVALSGASCVVDDSKISGYDLGLMACQCKVDMQGCTLGNRLQSCLLCECSVATFDGCTFTGSKSGMVVTGDMTGSCEVRNCSFIDKAETAIVVKDDAHVNLSSCRIECSYCCLFVHLKGRATVTGCTVRNLPLISEDDLERCALVRVRTGGCIAFQDTDIEAQHGQPGVAVADHASEVQLARCNISSASGCAVAAKQYASCIVHDSTLKGAVTCFVVDRGSAMRVYDSYLDGEDSGALAHDGASLELHDCRIVCRNQDIAMQGALEVSGQGCSAVMTGGLIEGAKVAVAVRDGGVTECRGVHACGNNVSFSCGRRSVLFLSGCMSDDVVPYEAIGGGEVMVSDCIPDDKQFAASRSKGGSLLLGTTNWT
jgi:Right handed beta helix region